MSKLKELSTLGYIQVRSQANLNHYERQYGAGLKLILDIEYYGNITLKLTLYGRGVNGVFMNETIKMTFTDIKNMPRIVEFMEGKLVELGVMKIEDEKDE